MYYTVLYSFKNLSEPEIILFADNVIQQTTTNAIFASLKSVVDPVRGGYDVFKTAFNIARNGGSTLVADKTKKHKELLVALAELAKGVDDIAKGDKDIITASGFKPSNEAQMLESLGIPQNFKVYNELENGVITQSWDKVERKTGYLLQMREFGTDIWQQVAAPTAATFTMKGLKRGLHLEFRVCATGTRNIVSEWSAIKDVYVD